MAIQRQKVLAGLFSLLVSILLLSEDRLVFAASPIISERYIIILDLSGTFLKDPANINMSVDKMRLFGEAIEKAKSEEESQLKKEARGCRQPILENLRRISEFTIIGMGSRPRPIWSGSTRNFLDLSKSGDINRLVEKTVKESRRTGNSRCTDIRGALDLGFRRLKARFPERELIVRAGAIIFSDLLDDPPNFEGKCSNQGNPAPPEGEIWDDIVLFLEENQDGVNSPPDFLPEISFIALGVTEQANRAIDPVTLWTERLRSLEDSREPFMLEFRSFSDAVNYSIPAPERPSLGEIQSYLDNFDPIDGRRITERVAEGNGGGADLIKLVLVLVLGLAGIMFLLIILIVVVIVIVIFIRRRRRSSVTTNATPGRPANE